MDEQNELALEAMKHISFVVEEPLTNKQKEAIQEIIRSAIIKAQLQVLYD